MLKINAYISFKNNCREAMAFYHECIGGKLNLQIVKDSPMAASFPPHLQDIVLHASLENEGFTLLGSEMPNNEGEIKGHVISLMLVCDTKDEVYQKFNKLGMGGAIIHPVESFFAGTIGNLIDKYGTRWSVFTDEK